ncbi:MAG TPA: gas vesicle protein [Candidatus Limnocylindria bacterium]|nr:gas vesicle protein [Candidatus Limnocylindria bacterium]
MTARLAALPDEELSVLDLADRLLNRGVVITGEATISVGGVDLIYLGLNLILTATESIAQKEARLR